MLVMTDGIQLLGRRSIIVPEICRNLEWFERVVLAALVLKQVNLIPCEVCPLALVMSVEIPLQETVLAKVLALLRRGWQLLPMSHLPIVLSSLSPLNFADK